MPKTAGQELGSVLAPLCLLALLAGMVAGAVIGAVLAAVSAVQVAVDPEGFAGWGFGGLGLIPLLVGVPSGAVVAVAPAAGSAVSLFVQAWRRPFPSISAQSLAAAWGAGSASAILAGVVLPQMGGAPLALLAVGAAFVLVSFLLARALTTRLLRYRKAREAGDSGQL
jgi:hypothetical protein